jgi:small subunit ribosomal protein S20
MKAPLRNRAKTQIRKARRSIATNDLDGARQAVLDAVSALDKAAKKGAIHANNASRRKSRIMKQLHVAVSSQGE